MLPRLFFDHAPYFLDDFRTNFRSQLDACPLGVIQAAIPCPVCVLRVAPRGLRAAPIGSYCVSALQRRFAITPEYYLREKLAISIVLPYLSIAIVVVATPDSCSAGDATRSVKHVL